MKAWEKGRGTCKCKGSEVGTVLLCSRNREGQGSSEREGEGQAVHLEKSGTSSYVWGLGAAAHPSQPRPALECLLSSDVMPEA